jgi:hypothetical protein
MPAAAIAMCAPDLVLPLKELRTLFELLGQHAGEQR